uniref:MAM domain-containing protein 2-like n=1 Tax=Saccoglossus kowalevskii TaxID=10224 RepID=A0ABM0GZU2_SACKO|nr:PREDICTED: MAM domain-containing protein 2-like [Saccoglossus kowalevskii]
MFVTHSTANGFALNVLLRNDDDVETLLWTHDKLSDTDVWENAFITVPTCATHCEIVLEAVKGNSRYMEIGVDDVEIQEMVLTTLAPLPVVECDFEYDLCGFTQDDTDDFDWTLITGETPSGATGPTDDHTYGSTRAGSYIFTESSKPRIEGNAARLISPIYQPENIDDVFILTFYHHMHGTTMGTLNVYLSNVNETRLQRIWSKSGREQRTYGNHWFHTELVFNATSPFQVIFEGVIGASFLSDMAIDDYSLLRNASDQSTVATSTTKFVTFDVIPTSDGTIASDAPHPYITESSIVDMNINDSEVTSFTQLSNGPTTTRNTEIDNSKSKIPGYEHEGQGGTSLLPSAALNSTDNFVTKHTSEYVFLVCVIAALIVAIVVTIAIAIAVCHCKKDNKIQSSAGSVHNTAFTMSEETGVTTKQCHQSDFTNGNWRSVMPTGISKDTLTQVVIN